MIPVITFTTILRLIVSVYSENVGGSNEEEQHHLNQ